MPTKELHIIISQELHRKFFAKVGTQDISVSQKVRMWIRQYLAGEIE